MDQVRDQVDVVVIGAGVVGLAVARALALQGREVMVLERAEAIGTGTSSRNSEVIHAGIYYPAGSLKARLCVRGKALLYDYCAARSIGHRRCGKLIVATDDAQAKALSGIQARAAANGVNDLVWLTGEQARALEPQLVCVAALHSPSTGIVDSHGLMLSLLGDLENAGGLLAIGSGVSGIDCTGTGTGTGMGAGLVLTADDVQAGLYTRGHVDDLPRIARRRNVLENVLGERRAGRRLLGVDDRRSGRDHDFFRAVANFQLLINAGLEARRDDDVRTDGLLEALQLERHAVRADRHVGELIRSRRSRHSHQGLLKPRARNGDRHAGHHAARRVGNLAEDRTNRLSVGRHG